MPFLQYKCTQCQKRFEELVKVYTDKVVCPDCGKEHKIYGESHIDEIASKHNIPLVAKIPIDGKLTAACDKGTIELFENPALDKLADYIESL